MEVETHHKQHFEILKTVISSILWSSGPLHCISLSSVLWHRVFRYKFTGVSLEPRN